MHLFCAEASSLGVQSCTTPDSKSETSPGTSIDLKKESTGLLITPDLWLSDYQLDNPINIKLECNEETELHSMDSEPEEQNCEAPLNLVHSSRRAGHSLKRKSNFVEITEIPLSKKGKSHKKSHHSTSLKTSAHTSNLIPPPPPTPPFSSTAWPSFPYPPHVIHPSYILQSQVLALNRSLKPLKDAFGEVHVPLTSTIESINKLPSEMVNDQATPIKSLSPVAEHINIEEKNKSNTEDEKISTPAVPPHFVVLRIPYLIPLPIPVPIPIPLNIHEKYLKHVLT